MDVILLGPPGAGKGTQARLLEDREGLKKVSTGDLLRIHRTDGTELGKTAQAYMDRGDLVPDDLILAMMEGEMDRASGGLLLDGFPRTVGQAEAFDKILERRQRAARVILFDIDLDVVAERLSGRWTNPRSGRVYHEKHAPPAVAGIDDEDGGALMQREDDKPETIRKRLAIYSEQTKPLVAYYTERNRLRRIDAAQPMDAVTREIEAVLHPPEGDRAA